MPDPWFPGAVIMPGRNAGYRAGRNAMRCAVHHYTVGVDSTNIGLDGYFHILLPKVGAPEMYAEIDATTYHAGEANPYGPGIELERMGDWEPPTLDQNVWAGRIDQWLRDVWGIVDHYVSDSAGRISPGELVGFVNHNNVQQSQGHVDYWSDAEVANMRTLVDGPGPEDPDMAQNQGVLTYDATGAWWVLTPAGTRYRIWTADEAIALAGLGFIPHAELTTYSQAFIDRFVVTIGPDPVNDPQSDAVRVDDD